MTLLPYKDPTLTTQQRVEDLLQRLTLEEKAGQLTQYFHFFAGNPNETDAESLPEWERHNHGVALHIEKSLAAGTVGSLLFIANPEQANRLQKIAVEQSAHGIPIIFGFDVIHGLRTIFPVPIAQAASWKPEGAQAAQTIAAREARASGVHWTFAPMVDITRDPRWGRIIEGAGEDPYLGSAMAAAQVRGFQGDLGAESVLSGPKHFAGYGAPSGGRDYEESNIADSELHNVILPPFKAAIDAGAANIMSAYMELNGVPATGNKKLLTDILRGEFGFTGFVVSDANAVKSLETQHYAKDPKDAAARALAAGLDMEMAADAPAYDHLAQAVRDGLVSEDILDESVRRVLSAKFSLGLFENPYADVAASAAVLTATAHRQTARDVAADTFVLLKNDNVLPLAPAQLDNVAVIGQLADSKVDTIGPWVFCQELEETVTILEGLRSRLGSDVEVTYEPGVGLPRRVRRSMFDNDATLAAETPEDWNDDEHLALAVEAARAADVAVVVVGQRQNLIGEKASVSTLELAGRQAEQVAAIAATGTPVVVLVMSGRPLSIGSVVDNAGAVLQVWYPGTRGGDAVAQTLVGDVSPAGRLPFTWPQHVGHVPVHYSHYRTFDPNEAGIRYHNEEDNSPLFRFGYGLSYASFEYSDLQLSAERVAIGESVEVSVTITNTSGMDADEVAQLYIHQMYGTSARPIRELKGFQRVRIAAGSSERLTFELSAQDLTYWSDATRTWIQDATTIEVYVGGSSQAALTANFEVQ